MSFVPALSTTASVALAANLPLGFWRATTRKFSWQWFAAVHLSVPFIIAMRLFLHVPIVYIPLTLGLAVAGQIVGSRIYRQVRRWRESRTATEKTGQTVGSD